MTHLQSPNAILPQFHEKKDSDVAQKMKIKKKEGKLVEWPRPPKVLLNSKQLRYLPCKTIVLPAMQCWDFISLQFLKNGINIDTFNA